MVKQYFSKYHKKWVNFSDEDFHRESDLKKYKYKIRDTDDLYGEYTKFKSPYFSLKSQSMRGYFHQFKKLRF